MNLQISQKHPESASNLAPIALFAYKRIDYLPSVIDSLLANPLSSQSKLFIFCDAPKTLSDLSSVQLVRDYVHSIQGFQAVSVIERAINFGLARSIVDGVTCLCSQYGKVIVIEDDVIVSSRFLEFINRALQEYADNPKVFQISGYMYPGNYMTSGDTFFLSGISCWGWATWKRAWQFYDPFLDGLKKIKYNYKLRERFDLNGAYNYYGMARKQLAGHIDSWGICWQWSVFRQNGLVLYPSKSMAQNLGVYGFGTHGAGHHSLQTDIDSECWSECQVKFPDRVELSLPAQAEVERRLRSLQPSWNEKILGRFRKIVKWL